MATASDAVRITGLREFQSSLRRMDSKLPRQLRVMLNMAAGLVVKKAEPMVPHRSGRAAGSIRVASTQRLARVKAGGARAPYYPWLDFGGSVGRHHSVHRAFLKEGRFLYPAYRAERSEIIDKMSHGLADLARSAGLEVR